MKILNRKLVISCIIGFILSNAFVLYYIENHKSLIFSGTLRQIEIDKSKKYEIVTVKKLIEQYSNIEFADNKYKDNVITISGKIFSINSEKDYTEINLYSDEFLYNNIKCYMYEKYDKSYKQDDIVMITGIVKGKFFDIILDYCYLEGNRNDYKSNSKGFSFQK